MTQRSARNWIDGAFVAASTHGVSIDPATSETIGEYADDGGAAAAAAIAAAQRAFRQTGWARDAELRARVLDQMAAAVERHRGRLIDVLPGHKRRRSWSTTETLAIVREDPRATT